MSKKFKVSHSKIKTWRTCKMKYHYKYIEKLRPRKKAPPLVRGTIIHSMLEAKIKGKNPFTVLRKAKKSYQKMFKEEKQTYDLMMEDIKFLMKGYFDNYKEDPIKYIGLNGKYSEHYFEVPLTPSIVLIGYIDSAGEKDDLDWLVEHKSHRIIPGGDLKYSDLQSALYGWVMPQIGLPEPDGVCWDYIKAKSPTRPQLLADGKGLSKRANIDTIWPVYQQAIKEHGFDESDYLDMKEKLEDKKNEFYVRRYLPINKHIIESLLEDVITTAKEMKRKGGKDKTRNIDKHCEWCDYYSLCQADLRGLDGDFIRENNFERGSRNENQETKK